MVGLTGFEPAASSSRTRRATKLRHSPPLPCQKSGWATRASIPERCEPPEIAPSTAQAVTSGPAFRVRVRWVTPLGEETASMS